MKILVSFIVFLSFGNFVLAQDKIIMPDGVVLSSNTQVQWIELTNKGGKPSNWSTGNNYAQPGTDHAGKMYKQNELFKKFIPDYGSKIVTGTAATFMSKMAKFGLGVFTSSAFGALDLAAATFNDKYGSDDPYISPVVKEFNDANAAADWGGNNPSPSPSPSGPSGGQDPSPAGPSGEGSSSSISGESTGDLAASVDNSSEVSNNSDSQSYFSDQAESAPLAQLDDSPSVFNPDLQYGDWINLNIDIVPDLDGNISQEQWDMADIVIAEYYNFTESGPDFTSDSFGGDTGSGQAGENIGLGWDTPGGYWTGAGGIGPSENPDYYSSNGGGPSGESDEFQEYKKKSIKPLDSLIMVPPRPEWIAVDGLDGRDAWLSEFGMHKIHKIVRRTYYLLTWRMAGGIVSIASPAEKPWRNHVEICGLDLGGTIPGYVQLHPKGLPKIIAAINEEGRLDLNIKLLEMEDGKIIAQAMCPTCKEPQKGVVRRQTFIVWVNIYGSQETAAQSLERLVLDLNAEFPPNTVWVGGDAKLPEAFVSMAVQDGGYMYVRVVNTTERELEAHPIHFSSKGEHHEAYIILPPGTSAHEWQWPEDWTDTNTILYVQNGRASAREHWDGSPQYGDRLRFYLQRDIFSPNQPNLWLYHQVVPDDYWQNASLDCTKGECFDYQKEFYFRTTSQFKQDLMHLQGKNVVLTFDDGSEDWVDILPLLEQYQVRAIFFACTRMTSPELLRTLSEHPWARVESHAHNHRRLSTLSDDEIRGELRESREFIEQATGVSPTLLALPYGDGGSGKEFERILKIARQEGYRGIRTSRRGSWDGPRLDVQWVATASAELPLW